MRVFGQDAIASIFGVTGKTVCQWQENGFPVIARGGPGREGEYDTADCVRWLVDREVFKVRGENPKDRLHRLQGDDLEMKLAVARGALVPVDQVEPAMKAAIVSARERVRGEPARIALQMEGLSASEREGLLRDLFDDVLTKLANWRQSVIEGDDERAD